jgi:hypothetical protein
MKKPFLELFGRHDVPAEEISTFADWLAAILIANQVEGARYPLFPTEARAVLRRAGVSALSSVGHRLAIEMESTPPEQKLRHWKDVVGPVFQVICHSMWNYRPLPQRSSSSKFYLQQETPSRKRPI